ncbi:MAG: hypothetical protein JW795_20170, partial [Chitinivibrionales bacterium]|nr:hypothetical protein [Chitinivibrionales bacterium]
MKNYRKMDQYKNKLASKYLYDERTKEQREFDVLMGFLTRIGVKDFIPIQESPPKPDFMINFQNGQIVGCELTDLYWDTTYSNG